MDESDDLIPILDADRIAGVVALRQHAPHGLGQILIKVEDDDLISGDHDIACHEVEEIKRILDEGIFERIQAAAPVALFDDTADLVLGVGEIDFITEGDPPQAEDAARHKKAGLDEETVQVAVQTDDPCMRSKDGQRIDQRMRPGEKNRPHPVR